MTRRGDVISQLLNSVVTEQRPFLVDIYGILPTRFRARLTLSVYGEGEKGGEVNVLLLCDIEMLRVIHRERSYALTTVALLFKEMKKPRKSNVCLGKDLDANLYLALIVHL